MSDNTNANLKQVYSNAVKDLTPSNKPQSMFRKLFKRLKKNSVEPIQPTLKQILPK